MQLNNAKNYKFSNFFLWVFITRHCNCTCEYCKQGEPSKYTEVMTADTLRYILDICIAIHNKGLVNKFSFEIAGGEPLLNFDIFSNIIPIYKEKYQDIFNFSIITNGTVINDEIIYWVKIYLGGICVSIDDIVYSKPINGVSSSNVQMGNIKKLKDAGVWVFGISVFDYQESMIPMAEFAIKYFSHWKILIAKPIKHRKNELLKIVKPVLQFLYQNNKYTDTNNKWFDFDGWNLWTKQLVGGCPCGRRLLGILPDSETIPGNGEAIIKLGKFNTDLMSLLNHPLNSYYKHDIRPIICNNCEIKDKCDGGCRSCHFYPDNLKERCDAIKHLFDYVNILKRG